nr:MAG TPA: hypothetical protein [Caudoviricetes sp.]
MTKFKILYIVFYAQIITICSQNYTMKTVFDERK